MKKILGLTIAALLVMALVGGGTWAYFSDVEAATELFSAGTIDLEGAGTWSAGISLTDQTPSTTAIGTVTYKNVGSLTSDLTFTEDTLAESDHANDLLDPAVYEFAASWASGLVPAQEMSAAEYQKLIYVTIANDGGATSVITEDGLSSKNSDGYISLYELVNNTNTVAVLPTWTSNESITLTFYFADAFDNLAQDGVAPTNWTTYKATADGEPTSHFYILEGENAVEWNVPQADGLSMNFNAVLTQQ